MQTGSQRWQQFSISSKSSDYSDVFDDPHPRRPYSSIGKVFSVDAGMRYTHSHVLRYGTTRSMPDHHHHHQHDHDDVTRKIANGHATAGRRLYSSNARKPATHRMLPAASNFKRAVPERKEDAVTFFDIEMDKSPFYQYRPGEEISGAVHLDIRHNVEIRYVELVIVGQGTITVLKAKQGLPSTVRETYLRKQTFVIGTGDAAWSSVLTPGHYLSRFRFRLPKNLPSSIQHDDLSSGFTMDVNYFIKVTAGGRCLLFATLRVLCVRMCVSVGFIQRLCCSSMCVCVCSALKQRGEVERN